MNIEDIKQSLNPFEWHWDAYNTSKECQVSEDGLEVLMHPGYSTTTVAIRGSKPLSIHAGAKYFWEVSVGKAFGTSIQFGICTKKQKLFKRGYCSLIGSDQNGWSLSHKGHLWHKGKLKQFCSFFPTQFDNTVAMYLDGNSGTLSYFVNGKYLGVAFTNLENIDCDLYPVIGSTSQMTSIKLLCSRRSIQPPRLKDLSKKVIRKRIRETVSTFTPTKKFKKQQYLQTNHKTLNFPDTDAYIASSLIQDHRIPARLVGQDILKDLNLNSSHHDKAASNNNKPILGEQDELKGSSQTIITRMNINRLNKTPLSNVVYKGKN